LKFNVPLHLSLDYTAKHGNNEKMTLKMLIKFR